MLRRIASLALDQETLGGEGVQTTGCDQLVLHNAGSSETLASHVERAKMGAA